MRLATITNWAYGATVALTLVSAGSMLIAAKMQDRERAAIAERYTLDRATSHIDEDAGELSRLARQYAISGNAGDSAAYDHEIAMLRSVEQQTAAIHDPDASIDEMRSLHEALQSADALRAPQQAAIAARRAGNKPLAIALLFAPEYERDLDHIQAEIARFQDRIDERTAGALATAVTASKIWRGVSETVLAATGALFLCVLYFVFRRRVLKPVVTLSDVVTRLAAQDYAAEPPSYDRIDEIGDMAQALRVFRDNGIARLELEHQRDADRMLRDLLSRMTQRLQGCDEITDLQRVVQCFVPEVVPQLAGRLYLLDRGRNALVEACAWLDPQPAPREFAPTACWALRRGGEHRTIGDVVDVPCLHVSAGDGPPPQSICLPLSAQSGVLGMLYFEVPPGTAAGGIADTHLQVLAENISLALDNLRLRDALRELAMADPLTKLANRRQLDLVLGKIAASPEQPVSCIMIDIDHFKRFNDEYGHEAGDVVLREVGAILRQSVRPDDIAFRYGGEEFLVLLPGADTPQAQARAEQLRGSIATLEVEHNGRDLGAVTISAGVATAPRQCTADQLVQHADAALLAAKRAGRDRVMLAADATSSDQRSVR